MDAALGFVEAGPAPGAFALALPGRAGAREAADGAVPPVVQRVVRDLVRAEVFPDGLPAPGGHRVELEDVEVAQLVELVELQNGGLAARLGLLPTDAGDPDGQLREPLLQRDHLAQRAAEIGRSLPELVAVLGGLLLHRLLGQRPLDRDAEEILQPFLEFHRLREKQPGVEREDRQPQPRPHRVVDHHQPRALEARPDRRPAAEAFPRPAKDLLQRRRFKLSGEGLDFLKADFVRVERHSGARATRGSGLFLNRF